MFKLIAATIAGVLAVTPASAVLMASGVKVTSANGTYIQIAELQAFSGSTNVALASNGATATAYSSLLSFTGPDKANDGLTDGQPYGDGVYIAAGSGPSEYLLITFAHAYNITALNVFGREDCCQDRDSYRYQLLNVDVPVYSGGMNAVGQGGANVGAAALPEATTWAMMLGGFGMMGATMRRRRPATNFA